ncbi:MAG: hypothetical protein MI976_05480 [Pseudomonadales bacterium]|nr:hypothetical protein [Pseudomonadales bacterium]
MFDAETNLKHFIFDLHLLSKLTRKDRCIMTAPLSRQVLSQGTHTQQSSCRLGVMATMVDVAGSDPVLATWNPDWAATQDLSIHSTQPLNEGPIVVDARLLREGKKINFISAAIYDGQGMTDLDELQAAIDAPIKSRKTPVLAAQSLTTFTRIPRTAATGVDSYDPNQWIGKVRTRDSGEINQQSLDERIGLQLLDSEAGITELSNNPYIANSIGTINGGVQATMLEAAAIAMRPHLRVADTQIHFLSQLKVGPARTQGTLIRDAQDHSVVLIQLMDTGADNKLLATATFTLQS